MAIPRRSLKLTAIRKVVLLITPNYGLAANNSIFHPLNFCPVQRIKLKFDNFPLHSIGLEYDLPNAIRPANYR